MPLRPDTHDYRHAAAEALHDSPLQRHFRELCPMPYGVVFLPWEGMTEDDMRQHFRLMKRLGFHNLKQTMGTAQWPTERILSVALDEGVIPFWYGEGGFEPVPADVLAAHGLPATTPLAEAIEHPGIRQWQHERLRERIGTKRAHAALEGTVLQDAGFEKWQNTALRLHPDPVLRPEAVAPFQRWCRERYGTIEALVKAWNQHEVGISGQPYTSWEDFFSDTTLGRHNHREYRYLMDVLRFKADVMLSRIRQAAEANRARHPWEPQRAGGEMGLFLPFAWRGTDMEGIAEVMREHGSFYPSIHLAWHFEEVYYEVARPIYMQASLCADWFRGGWSATWESTGGPQQFSGGKGWNPHAAAETPGFTVDAGTIAQLLLSYLAGGFRGAGLWAWNFRRAGWEAGEYALLNRQGEAGPRAIRAGRIAQAAHRLRRELWAARKEPYVGLFVNWEQEALWGALSQSNRDHFRDFPVHSRIGASRALINGNIPWEHLLASDLRAGLAPRYRVIFLPAQLSIPHDVLELLIAYVQQGGRVVLDAPGGWFDEQGKVLPTGPGSGWERLTGTLLRDFQYNNNPVRHLRGEAQSGFVLQLEPTAARVIDRFDTGEPAATEHTLGAGTVVVLAHEAAHVCCRPGHEAAEARLRHFLVGHLPLPYACDEAIVYRQRAPQADHYFLLNDGPAKSVFLRVDDADYALVEDPETGERLALPGPIALEGAGARWLRALKA